MTRGRINSKSAGMKVIGITFLHANHNSLMQNLALYLPNLRFYLLPKQLRAPHFVLLMIKQTYLGTIALYCLDAPTAGVHFA